MEKKKLDQSGGNAPAYLPTTGGGAACDSGGKPKLSAEEKARGKKENKNRVHGGLEKSTRFREYKRLSPIQGRRKGNLQLGGKRKRTERVTFPDNKKTGSRTSKGTQMARREVKKKLVLPKHRGGRHQRKGARKP